MIKNFELEKMYVFGAKYQCSYFVLYSHRFKQDTLAGYNRKGILFLIFPNYIVYLRAGDCI